MNPAASNSSADIPLVRAVFNLPEDRSICRRILRRLPTYVEAEVGGYAHRSEFNAIRRHVLLCPDCQPIYLEVLMVAMADQRGEL